MKKFSELINSKTPVLVDFYAEWCGPCKTLTPILKDLSGHYGKSLKVIKVDVDKNQQAVQKYKIMGVPTLILFKDSKILWQQPGVLGKAELISIIDRELKKQQ